jgi:hypothetical protein
MTDSFLYNLEASYLVTILFCLMLLVSYLGYKLSIKKNRKTIDNSTLLSSLLALFGLLLAFTFGMSGSRFDDRRKSIVDEVNCIGTAILRTDLYPDSLKKELKKDLLKYLDARITYFEAKRNSEQIDLAIKNATLYSNSIWQKASVLSSSKDQFLPSMLMIPSLNEMFDIASTSNAIYNARVPDSIIYLLLLFSIICSAFIGYNAGFNKTYDKTLIIGFCLLTCVVIYIVLDLDRPRRGLINQESGLHLFHDLRNNQN